MAETFTQYCSGVAFAASRVMAGIKNKHASEKLKIKRIGLLNGQTAAVTGVLCNLEVRKDEANPTWTGPTVGVITEHDSTNTLPASYDQGHTGTFTASGSQTTLRRTNWSSDEAAVSGATMDELECFVPLNIIFDPGYGDADAQPLVLNQNEMLYVWNVSGAAGLLDIWTEFLRV